MKIDGIEPGVLSRILEKPGKPQVQVTEKPSPDRPVRRQREEREADTFLSGEQLLEQLEQGTERLNDTARAFNLSLRFQLHHEAERWMVQVVDSGTMEVVSEIPPEKMLNVVAQIKTLIGLLLDEKR